MSSEYERRIRSEIQSNPGESNELAIQLQEGTNISRIEPRACQRTCPWKNMEGSVAEKPVCWSRIVAERVDLGNYFGFKNCLKSPGLYEHYLKLDERTKGMRIVNKNQSLSDARLRIEISLE